MIALTYKHSYGGIQLSTGSEIDEALTLDAYNAISNGMVAKLVRAGFLLENRIKRLLSMPGSGAWYTSKSGGGMHQASAPGEPPATDTGRYRASWISEVTVSEIADGFLGWKMRIGTALWETFGRRLELGGYGGGAYIAPRPHVRAAYDGATEEVNAILQE
jgi:hypothetical protein